MDTKTLIIIGVAVALLAVALGFFLLTGKREEEWPTPPADRYYYGIGEATAGSESEALSSAKSKALSDMLTMVLAEVLSESRLKKSCEYIGSETGEGKKVCEESHVKDIMVKAGMEITGYETKSKVWKEGGEYHAKVMVWMSKPRAKLYVRLYTLYTLLKTSAKAGLIFTASEIMTEFDTVQMALGHLPKAMSDAKEIEAEISSKLEEANGYISKLKSMKPTTVDEQLTFLELYSKLLSIARDIPEDTTEYVSNVVKSFSIKITLSGPEEVVKTQRVDLNLSVEGSKGSHTFEVVVKGGDFPKSVTVEKGSTKITGYVSGDVIVTVKLTDLLKTSWSPGAVLSPKIANVASVLVKSVRAPSQRVVILPKTPSDDDMELAVDVERAALNEGWSLVTHEKLSEEVDKLKWDEDWHLERVPAVLVGVDGDRVFIEGAVAGEVVVKQITFEGLKDKQKEDILKAAVASKNVDLVLRCEDHYLRGLALYVTGKLDDAATEFSKTSTPLAKLALARVFYDQGDYKKCVDSAYEVAGDYPEQSFKLIAKAYALAAKEGDLSYLLGEMRRLYMAVKKVKDNHAGYYAMAILLQEYGNCREAIDWILKALDIKPQSVDYLLQYAKILVCLGKKDEAAGVLEKLKGMKLKPSQERTLKMIMEEMEK